MQKRAFLAVLFVLFIFTYDVNSKPPSCQMPVSLQDPKCLAVAHANIVLDPYVSRDQNILASCDNDFNAQRVIWDFGDGTIVERNGSNSYYHTYLRNAAYVVKCVAIVGSFNETAEKLITIKTEASAQEINSTLPLKWTDWFNPYVFRPIVERVNGSTFKVGGYSVGLPRNLDNLGQSGYWASTTGFYSDYTSIHDAVLTITYPEPGNYVAYPEVGFNDETLTPEQYTAGFEKRGCSNPRVICQGASGRVTVTVPDLGTRSQFGIITRNIGPLIYSVSCQSYSSDAGFKSYVYDDSGNSGLIQGNGWLTFNYSSKGSHEITCYNYVEYAMKKIYKATLNV